ncbi:MAG: hypothetical protein WBX01_17210 [Nitrososphaeraceae archaeon]
MGGWSDGTLVMKNLAIESGCGLQGFNAVIQCPGNSSTLVAVDSNTLEILDWEEIDQLIGGRVTATQYNGTNYVYLPGTTDMYRYVWDGQNLTPDESWGPVPYLLPNQTAASACGIMHDWVICQTNGGSPTNVPVSVFAISQANSSKITRIQPIPLEPGQISYIPSIPSFDPTNNRIYNMDPGPGKVAAAVDDSAFPELTLPLEMSAVPLMLLRSRHVF